MGSKIQIITDSTCDLSKEILEKYDIKVLSLFVNFGEESYLDGIEMDAEKLYGLVEIKNELPKTAAVSIGVFIEEFQKCVDNDLDVIYMGISAKMSSTFNNALLASKEVDENRVHVFDSANLSTGIGLLLLKACKFRDQGMSATDIITKLEEIRPLVRSQFAIETMEYLYKGGRCSGLTKWFGSVFKIKPIIEVRNGEMGVGKLPRGKMKVALNSLLDYLDKEKDNIDLDHIFVTHSIAPESQAYLYPEVKKRFPNVDILETVAGSVISSHCGRGTIGILFIVNK